MLIEGHITEPRQQIEKEKIELMHANEPKKLLGTWAGQ